MSEGSSADLFEEAREVIPGGVNSPVRAFSAVGGSPAFIARAAGAHVWDVEGTERIDYVGSWGPLILGHARPDVLEAVRRAAENGTSFGAPTEAEVRLARLIVERVPSVETVRLVNSGTEACMTALRLARAFTGRDRFIKFTGCYHGHADAFLVQAGSGATTLGTPSSPGVPEAVIQDTLTAEFNDPASVGAAIAGVDGRVAAVIVEPVCGNAGVIPPEPGFLEGLREACDRSGALLIFDEVMTGFRVGPGSAQGLYGVMPDLTTLGKVIGGGLPVGAIGGRRTVMEQLAPVGPVYQAGTLSGNPLATAAGLATLSRLDAAAYERLEALSARLEDGILRNLADLSLPWQYQRVGSMGCLFFAEEPVGSYADARTCDTERFGRYFRAMLDRGVYLPPSQFEACFISTAHSEEDIDRTVGASREALQLTA
jgi:glutamate-1-semialdehyde 2,1-aminomutase